MSANVQSMQELPQMLRPHIPIPSTVLYGIHPFLKGSAIIGNGSPDDQESQMLKRLHPSDVDPSLFESAMFLGAVCDLAYQGDSRERMAAALLLDALSNMWGIDREHLETLLLPSCGLSERDRIAGHRGRSYVAALPMSGCPLLIEPSGRMHTGVPHRMPSEARDRWRCIRAQLPQKQRTQARRLELAMIAGRRWPLGLFTEVLLPHPLLRVLLRRVVCAGYDARGVLIEGFLVQENGDCVSDTYGVADLARYTSVGVPHPVDISPDQARAWADLLDDFQILPLFPQLRRPIASPLADERRAVTRFAGMRFTIGIATALAALGWNAPLGASAATLEIPGELVRAVLDLRVERAWVSIEACTFSAGGRTLHLEDVPPRMFCEALWHMALVAENPKLRAEA